LGRVGAEVDTKQPTGNYSSILIHDGIAYLSGVSLNIGDDPAYTGKVGGGIDIEAAQEAAATCADLCLSAINHVVGGEDNILQILKIVGYVVSVPGFTHQSNVVNGASDRLIERLGERGRHARTSVGVAELPKGSPVGLDMIAAVRT
jgi:enamine deaminase RidA (YjgF/YER057c/UK114 family)